MIVSLTHFQRGLILLLCGAFAALMLLGPSIAPTPEGGVARRDVLQVFTHPQCPHCREAMAFLRAHEDAFPPFIQQDVTTPRGQHALAEVVERFSLPQEKRVVPLFVYGDRWRVGFISDAVTGPVLREWVGEVPMPDGEVAQVPEREAVTLPLVGEVSLEGASLPVLTVLLGLADGFNPCAMWVLVYLISVIAGLKDRRKIIWLVGSFVLASGILYFLFMTAWLNAFLFVGFTRPLTLLIALSAIGFGINHLYELIQNRGAVACEVGDVASRQQTMGKIRRLVNAPMGGASIMAMFGLAFAVNAIEFVCSAALPAIYTHMLSLMELSAFSYYGYILLYVLFFMLDDLIIFGLAAFAVQKVMDSRYAAYSRALGGLLLIGLGLWMLGR